MECKWSEVFSFDNRTVIWKNVQKHVHITDNKLFELNIKVLQNILPFGYIHSKWNYYVSEKCEVCKNIETIEHTLFLE